MKSLTYYIDALMVKKCENTLERLWRKHNISPKEVLIGGNLFMLSVNAFFQLFILWQMSSYMHYGVTIISFFILIAYLALEYYTFGSLLRSYSNTDYDKLFARAIEKKIVLFGGNFTLFFVFMPAFLLLDEGNNVLVWLSYALMTLSFMFVFWSLAASPPKPNDNSLNQ